MTYVALAVWLLMWPVAAVAIYPWAVREQYVDPAFVAAALASIWPALIFSMAITSPLWAVSRTVRWWWSA